MKKIILYGAEWCPACKTAKSYFEDKKLSFIYKDVEIKDNFLEFSSKGVSSIPVIMINDEIIVGFNVAEINARLN